ncbi:MAG: hypothetical protein HYW85_05995, partial [Deltaproteobacteria bacterium]|nr:hypothetical protein [Deltaproteobacteria bacterium]
RPQSEASVQAFVYAALQDYYDSEDCSRAVLEFKEDGTFILKRGEITLLCKKDLMIGRKNGPSLESALARLETVFENRGVEPVWFTQDLVRGLDRDMLERAGRVNAEALARYLEFRLASADLEEDLAVDRDSVAFKTLLEEMQRGRISVLEKLPHLTRIFLREGLKQIKER